MLLLSSAVDTWTSCGAIVPRLATLAIESHRVESEPTTTTTTTPCGGKQLWLGQMLLLLSMTHQQQRVPTSRTDRAADHSTNARRYSKKLPSCDGTVPFLYHCTIATTGAAATAAICYSCQRWPFFLRWLQDSTPTLMIIFNAKLNGRLKKIDQS
jgi:hypothetical protein